MKNVVFTLRLPPKLYEGAKRAAKERGKSFSGYIRELLEEKLKEERKRKLYDAFSLMAEDSGEEDVEYAFEAQAQVVREE